MRAQIVVSRDARREAVLTRCARHNGAFVRTFTWLGPDPTFFHTGSAREPYNHGQWGSALRATPQATVGDVTDGQGLRQPVRSRAHGFQPRWPR
jgi:hypothetical protein